MSIDFHRKLVAIDNNRLIIIDYIDYIDCLSMIDLHRLGTPGKVIVFELLGKHACQGDIFLR